MVTRSFFLNTALFVYEKRAHAWLIITGLAFVASLYIFSQHLIEWDRPLLIPIFLFLSLVFITIRGWWGISCGMHRYFAHRTFNAKQWIQYSLAISAISSFTGTICSWAAGHRRHHRQSDREGDPHSPVYGFTGKYAKLKGWWWAHTGWFLAPDEPKDYERWIPDLLQNDIVRFAERWAPLWLFLSLALPGVIGGTMTLLVYEFFWYGAFLGLLTAGLASLFFMYQYAACVNSLGHLVGEKRFRTNDNSTNAGNMLDAIFSAPMGGERNQNDHHRFQWSALLVLPGSRGIDIGWALLKCAAFFGFVSDLGRPTSEQIAAAELSEYKLRRT